MKNTYRASRPVKSAFAQWPGELTHGVCILAKGRHAGRGGRLVYYDDDEGGLCAVYFGRTLLGPTTWVRRSSLRPATLAQAREFSRATELPHPLGG